jgi:glycosyltransferase involved in cell wall biosynthesis
MRITVAIPTYNRAELLRQTLAGIARQDYPQDQFEVLVIDNNSRDHTRDVVLSFAGARPAPRYLVETKQGLDYGRNRAVAEARGEILVLADDDILVEPDWLQQMTAPFDADRAGKIGCVGGEVVPVFPDGLPGWMAEWYAPLAFRRDAGPLPSRQTPKGANMAFPRWVFEKVGLFSTVLDRTGKSLFSGGESELIRRIRKAGLEVWFAPAARVRHQMPASRTTFKWAARHAFDSARSRVVDRVLQGRAGGYLASRLGANLVKLCFFPVLALGNALLLRGGGAARALVRAWRSCGYLYQIPRSLVGRI